MSKAACYPRSLSCTRVMVGQVLCWAIHLLEPGLKNVHYGRIPLRYPNECYGNRCLSHHSSASSSENYKGIISDS